MSGTCISEPLTTLRLPNVRNLGFRRDCSKCGKLTELQVVGQCMIPIHTAYGVVLQNTMKKLTFFGFCKLAKPAKNGVIMQI